jgi:hypothetical protein
MNKTGRRQHSEESSDNPNAKRQMDRPGESRTAKARQPKSLLRFFRESPFVGVELDRTRDQK